MHMSINSSIEISNSFKASSKLISITGSSLFENPLKRTGVPNVKQSISSDTVA